MDYIELQRSEGIATLTLRIGKVNALNSPVVDQMREKLEVLEGDPSARAVLVGTVPISCVSI
jgi:enoyl-CoA hydratase/carnithine racemase